MDTQSSSSSISYLTNLLESGGEVSIKESYKETPFLQAATLGNTHIISEMVRDP
jgi:ankyrin repeat protein